MHYDSQKQAGAQLVGRGTPGMPSAPPMRDKPVLHGHLDSIEKLVAALRSELGQVQDAVDRLIGSVPTPCTDAEPERAGTVNDRLLSHIGDLQRLLGQASDAARRMDSAV